MKILVLSDNKFILDNFYEISRGDDFVTDQFDFYCSEKSEIIINGKNRKCESINIKNQVNEIINIYELVLSIHCKQLFPKQLVNSVRCINVHPGLNPYNRGWFPQVFSILNKLPVGVTIHEMDEELDHGPIIVQNELKVYEWETSYDIYKRIQLLEVELIRDNLIRIINNDYKTIPPKSEGNINFKKDFMNLCEIDLDRRVSFREALDYFRAMSFRGYKNAFFYDEFGNKIYVEVYLEKEVKDIEGRE